MTTESPLPTTEEPSRRDLVAVAVTVAAAAGAASGAAQAQGKADEAIALEEMSHNQTKRENQQVMHQKP